MFPEILISSCSAIPETIFSAKFRCHRRNSDQNSSPPPPAPNLRVVLEHPPVLCVVFPRSFPPPSGFFMLPPCCGRLPFFPPPTARPPTGLARGFSIHLGARLWRSTLSHSVAWVSNFSPVQRMRNLCSRGWGFGASAPGAFGFSPKMGASGGLRANKSGPSFLAGVASVGNNAMPLAAPTAWQLRDGQNSAEKNSDPQ